MSRARLPVHVEPKGWGPEVWKANTSLYCGKSLEIKTGTKCSLHFHLHKTESFYLRSGRLRIRVMESLGTKEIEAIRPESGRMYGCTPGLGASDGGLGGFRALFEFSTEHFDSDSHQLEKGD
jgi:hypothetical protein